MDKIIILIIILIIFWIYKCSSIEESFEYGFGSIYNTQYKTEHACDNVPGIAEEPIYYKKCGWIPEPMAAPNDTLKIINRNGGFMKMVGNKNKKAIVREYEPPIKVNSLLIPSGYRVILECKNNYGSKIQQYDNNEFYNKLVQAQGEPNVFKVKLLWLR